MCSSDPKRRCAAHTEPVAVAALGFYHQKFPDGAAVDPLSAVEATFVPIEGERMVTVPDPDDDLGMPIYDGPVSQSSAVLEAGEYKAYFADADPENARELALRIPESPTLVGDRVAHPTMGHGTVRQIGSQLASGGTVEVEWDNPRATGMASQVPTWEDPASLRRIVLSDGGGTEMLSPDWAWDVRVPARRFPDADEAAGEPVYWVTGAELRHLQDKAGLGSISAVQAGETSAYLEYDEQGPALHWPEEPGHESVERLTSREFEGETLYSLRGFTFAPALDEDEDED